MTTVIPGKSRFEGYHIQNNVHGVKQLVRPLATPNPILGIGFDETHNPLIYRTQYVTQTQKVLIPDLTQLPIERARVDDPTPIIQPEDFPHEHYSGETLGGF